MRRLETREELDSFFRLVMDIYSLISLGEPPNHKLANALAKQNGRARWLDMDAVELEYLIDALVMTVENASRTMRPDYFEEWFEVYSIPETSRKTQNKAFKMIANAILDINDSLGKDIGFNMD